MKLITEQVNDLSFVTEEIAGKKSLFVEGVFLQSDVKNKNGRMYPKEIFNNLEIIKVRECFQEQKNF